MKTNVIYQGKCSQIMQDNIPDNSIDLTITSPPYDNLRDYEGYEFDYKPIAEQLYRVTKKGGVVVWIVGDQTINGSETGNSFRQALYFKDVGFNLHDTMIYKKDNVTFPDANRYHQNFEYMFVLSKGKPKTVNFIKDRKNKNSNTKISGTARQKNGFRTEKNNKGKIIKEYGIRFNVWEYSSGYMKTTKDKFAYEHPAMFPEKLAKDHIKSWSNKNDVILDPMCGSGTVLKQTEILNRKWIGIDIAEKYVNLSYKRLGKLDKQYYEELPEEEKPRQMQLV